MTRLSVSQSVRQSWVVFVVSATPLKPLNRNLWNFVVTKDILCRCAYSQEILNQFFFLGITLKFWPKLNILPKQLVSATPLKPLYRISWNYVVMKDLLCRCAYLHKFFLGIMPLLNLEIYTGTTETVCQGNSSDTALNRISWNFVVMKDIMCRCAYPQEILIPFFFSELRPFWT